MAGDRVGRSGADLHPTHRADGARPGPRHLVHREREPGSVEQRVAAVAHRRGAGVVRLTGELDPPALPRRQHVGHAQRQLTVDQRPALLDVHLVEAAHPVELLAALRQRVAGDAVDRRRVAHHLEHVIDVQPPGQRQAGEGGGAKPRSLLVDERDHRQRMPAPGVGLEHRRRRLQRRHDSERPVIRAAVGLRVQVRPGAHPGPAVGVVGDRPQAAGAVLLHLEPDRRGRAREPGPRLGLERAPGQPVPAALAVADRGQLAEPRHEPFSGYLGHRSGRIRVCPIPRCVSQAS